MLKSYKSLRTSLLIIKYREEVVKKEEKKLKGGGVHCTRTRCWNTHLNPKHKHENHKVRNTIIFMIQRTGVSVAN